MEIATFLLVMFVTHVLTYYHGKRKARKESAETIKLLNKLLKEVVVKRTPPSHQQDALDIIMDYEGKDPTSWN